MSKVKIPWYTIVFFCFAFLSGFGKSIVQIFFLLSIHELLHLACAYSLHQPIRSITIYPFGMAISLPALEYRHSAEEFLVAISGPLSYLLSAPLLYIGYRLGVLSLANYSWLCSVNETILIFNCLPIYPLDGGRLVHALFHLFLPFKQALRCTILLSFGVLLLLLWRMPLVFSMYGFILLFLVMQLLFSYTHVHSAAAAFYRYRSVYTVPYKLYIHRKKDLYRNVSNLHIGSDGMQDELAWYTAYLRKNTKSNAKEHVVMI